MTMQDTEVGVIAFLTWSMFDFPMRFSIDSRILNNTLEQMPQKLSSGFALMHLSPIRLENYIWVAVHAREL